MQHQAHTFHIPVMGIGFTIDTPIKIAHYGISSVISLVDDILIEKMRVYYCKKFNLPFEEITNKISDFRAKRITAYLDTVDQIVKDKFRKLINTLGEAGGELEKYMDMLPSYSQIKTNFKELQSKNLSIQEIKDWLSKNLSMGSIDVNIMTKLDKENYNKNQLLPVTDNDAHAALRGFANSQLSSSIVFSAGMNPRLFSYIENFEDFYPDANGVSKKNIILKISDYRSALIQGKIMAKKGLFVKEYRIESGLNCGGHAFATEGHLMGPILEEFKQKREELVNETFNLCAAALREKGKPVPTEAPYIRITAQGGVGTAEEHQFLIENYNLDSVGWGTPFLLVPEVVNIDNFTLKKLSESNEKDIYLSNISPLGVPFYSLKQNTKDIERLSNIEKGRPGSACPKKYASLTKEFTEKAICSASRQYQQLKIEDLDKQNLPKEEYDKTFQKITEKSCICVGLGTSALLVNNLSTKQEGKGVSVCPGPNMAYLTEIVSLRKMTQHIYSQSNLIKRPRPNMFVKELQLYINYLKNKIEEFPPITLVDQKKINRFKENLQEGIHYYNGVVDTAKEKLKSSFKGVKEELKLYEQMLGDMIIDN